MDFFILSWYATFKCGLQRSVMRHIINVTSPAFRRDNLPSNAVKFIAGRWLGLISIKYRMRVYILFVVKCYAEHVGILAESLSDM